MAELLMTLFMVYILGVLLFVNSLTKCKWIPHNEIINYALHWPMKIFEKKSEVFFDAETLAGSSVSINTFKLLHFDNELNCQFASVVIDGKDCIIHRKADAPPPLFPEISTLTWTVMETGMFVELPRVTVENYVIKQAYAEYVAVNEKNKF